MKKKLALLLAVSLFAANMFAGCGATEKQEDTSVSVETEIQTTVPEPAATEEPAETPHSHIYTETVTKEPTCETDGEKTFTCECGDSYTEPVKAAGHVFENYVSNGDATYTADGTETAKCSNCDATDTRIVKGSMLSYTYTDMDVTMYAQQTANVRSMPSTDGEKVGSLSVNDEVKVTGQCAETSWYRIEYSGNTAYVSNSYLGNEKVAVEQPETETPAQSVSTPTEFPYELYTLYDNGTYFYFYSPEIDGHTKPQHWYDMCDACGAANEQRFATYSDFMDAVDREWGYSGYTLNGKNIMIEKRYYSGPIILD